MESRLPDLKVFLEKQLTVWKEAADNFAALEGALTRVFPSTGIRLQHNPSRIHSTAAATDKDSISIRRCFLCSGNRPAEQISADIGDGFELLVNPYPILREHFTVVCSEHTDQSLRMCAEKLVSIASALPEKYIIFYNGPHSGASAPDHLHMQIGTADGIPLVEFVKRSVTDKDGMFTVSPFGFPVTVMRNVTPEQLCDHMSLIAVSGDESEGRVNVIAFRSSGTVTVLVIRRGRHRPLCYYADGDRKKLVSPGALDMAGLVITPRKEDFESLTERDIMEIYGQVTPAEPDIRVGIVEGRCIRFRLETEYSCEQEIYSGELSVTMKDGMVLFNGRTYERIRLTPLTGKGDFTLHDVTIGRGFHWERHEEQRFCGSLEFVTDNDAHTVWAVNVLPVEDYLRCVVSSEMKSTAPLEFLKAHAVISRSWVLSQISSGKGERTGSGDCCAEDSTDCTRRIIRWYDHDGHRLFDVCADDHCQRYQGIGRMQGGKAEEAVLATRAEVLLYDGRICDARFSKCCGGVSERFSTCWQDKDLPYLVPIRDLDTSGTPIPDLSAEKDAGRWIRESVGSFCSEADPEFLSQSLNGYDTETSDYFRWKVRYTVDELSSLFARRSGMNLGRILSLTPLKRGASGRISELRVDGELGSAVIGKELEIRRVLSESHLYSSAFVVDTETDGNGTATGFVLSGAGWGHGVGLCQIGAAVMGSRGYGYRDILMHYYRGASIGRLY